jgi:WD40 repeat protein
MNSSSNRAVLNGAVLAFAAGIFVSPAIAQRDKQTFQQGDKVEVKDPFHGWKEGTVVGTSQFGRIEVRVEDPDIPLRIPKFAREQMMTRSYDPDDVRPLAEGKHSAPRTWKDRSGKFSVEASFGGTDGDKVILVRSGGKKVFVPMEKLSEADKTYVKEQTNPTENQFGDSNDDRHMTADVPITPADRSSTKMLKPQRFTKWTFTPVGDASYMVNAVEGRNAVVPLNEMPDLAESWESVTGIFATDDGTRVAIGRQEGLMDKRQYVELVDAEADKSLGLLPLPEETSLLDIDLATDRVMYRSEGRGFGKKNVLTIASCKDGKLTPIVRWEPYGKGNGGPDGDVMNAWFMGSKRVITVDDWRKSIVIWDSASVKSLLQVPIGVARQVSIAVSPDRTLLAIGGDTGISIIDLAAGRHVATIPINNHVFGKLAFRDDNARLAGLSDFNIYVWDLANGNQIAKFNTPYIGTFDVPLQWTANYLLAENCYLFDVDRRILLWQYQDSLMTRENGAIHRGQFYIVPESSNKSMLITMPLPHTAAVELAKKLPSADELLIAKAGDPVSIEVDIDPRVSLTPDVQKLLENSVRGGSIVDDHENNIVMLKPDDANKDLIRKALAAALTRAGFRVVANSNLVVTAVCKPQPQQSMRINVDGRNPPRPQDIVERTVTPHATYVAFTMNGEILWKRGAIAKPNMVLYLEKGETLYQALQRVTQPNMLLFTMMEFGSHVARPGEATEEGAYGVSQFHNGKLVDGLSRPSGNDVIE